MDAGRQTEQRPQPDLAEGPPIIDRCEIEIVAKADGLVEGERAVEIAAIDIDMEDLERVGPRGCFAHQRPLNSAARRSLKLCTPSAASSVAKRRCWSGPSSKVADSRPWTTARRALEMVA